MCTKNHNYMIYGSQKQAETGRFFCYFRPFFIFTPLMIMENKFLKKNEKVPRNIIVLHMCAINEDHLMYYS